MTNDQNLLVIDTANFHLDLLLQKALRVSTTHDDDLFELQDLSPLTSGPSTRNNSPLHINSLLPTSDWPPSTDSSPNSAVDEVEYPLGLGAIAPLPSSNPSCDPIPVKQPVSSPHPSPFSTDETPHTHPNIGGDQYTHPPRKKRKRTKERNKTQGHANRKKKRALQKSEHFSIPAKEDAVKTHVKFDEAVSTSHNAAEGPTTKGSYIAGKCRRDDRKTYSLDELIGPCSALGLKLVQWDGRTPKPIVDCEGTVIGIFAGRPEGLDWDESMRTAILLLEEARLATNSTVECHRRGGFSSLRCGVSHGGGQQQPGNLCNSRTNETILDKLNNSEPFKRISGFTSSIFATWAPQLYQYYQDTARSLHQKYPRLVRPFPQSVFCAATYNLGPQTVCFVHTDFANLPFGWCAVTALGDYDPTQGGHLVLWDLGVVVEFPPGSSALIPSAIVAHSNTTVQQHETRYSFTQYTAGGIFRWVEQGFKKRTTFLAGLGKSQRVEWQEKEDGRWKWGLSLFRTTPTAP